MIKLKSILEEIEATATLSKQEKAAYDDLIGSLKEASGKDFLTKVASYAKKGMLKGALLAALLNAPELSKAEKTQVQDLAKDTTTQTVAKVPKWKAEKHITVKKMDEWNQFVKWLNKTTVEDLAPYIETEYKGSGKLAGNSIMNHEDYSDVVLEVYKDLFPQTTLTKADIKPIQTQINDYRNWVIKSHIEGGGFTNKNNKIHFDYPVSSDYSNFMRSSSKSGEDGIVGVFTSQILFPRAYMQYFVDGKKVSTADLGYVDKDLKPNQKK